MSDNIPLVPITDLLSFIVDNRGKVCPTCENGFPLIATNCIKHSSIYPVFENIRYVSADTLKNWFRAELKPNDILFVNKGTPGRVCLVPDPVTFCVAQDTIGLRTNDKVYYKYLFAVLRSKFIQDKIANYHVGIAIPHFKKADLNNLLIPLPSMDIQHKIGDIYCQLSEKIENNNKINQELESLAKTIYDYWFLQFEFPNEEGKPYKSSGGKMVWNDELKREIPEGWEVENLGDICEFSNGINYDKNDPGDTQYKIVNVRNITASSLILDDSDFDVLKLKKSLGDKYIVNDGDILIARSGTPGAVRLLENPDGKTIYCGFIICGKPYNRNHKLLITYSLKQLEGTSATKTGGSILQNVSQETLKVIKVVIPNRFVLDKFNQTIQKNINMIVSKTKENQELASLRDFLLPMLMNGQVTFKEKDA